jgi:hypothetical protein
MPMTILAIEGPGEACAGETVKFLTVDSGFEWKSIVADDPNNTRGA